MISSVAAAAWAQDLQSTTSGCSKNGLQIGAINSAEEGCGNSASFGVMMTVQSGEF